MLAHIAQSMFNKLNFKDMADWSIANMYGGFKRRKISRVNRSNDLVVSPLFHTIRDITIRPSQNMLPPILLYGETLIGINAIERYRNIFSVIKIHCLEHQPYIEDGVPLKETQYDFVSVFKSFQTEFLGFSIILIIFDTQSLDISRIPKTVFYRNIRQYIKQLISFCFKQNIFPHPKHLISYDISGFFCQFFYLWIQRVILRDVDRSVDLNKL